MKYIILFINHMGKDAQITNAVYWLMITSMAILEFYLIRQL